MRKMHGERYLAFALAACMGLAFAGCGANVESEETTDSQTQTSENGGILKATDLTWRDSSGSNVYNASRSNSFFFSDQDDAVTYFCNAMYESYGYLTPSNQPYVGVGVGWCPAWYEWITLTRNWSDNDWAKQTWRSYIVRFPISANGYVWSYDTPHWPDLGHDNGHNNYHYDNNFRYITAVWQYMAWENSTAILDEIDDTSAGVAETGDSQHLSEDVSKGLTVGQKLDMAIEYVLKELNGENGLIIIDEEDNDGLNLGTTESYSSNYWDNIPFGYKDAYENILFYNTLNNLTQLETMRGNAQAATSYQTLAERVKTNFNETFWNSETGRYVGTVDVNGVKRDYGITFVNTEAVTAGLADAEKAKSIYDWIDGKRIVAGDTSTGEDIYKYIAAPRSNTLDYAAISENGGYWWHDNGGGQALSGNGTYGYHLENGGAILYTEYYDLMGRINSGDLTSAYERAVLLAKEYAKDELNRDPMNPKSGGYDVLGFVGEFPESGLVPTMYLYGFLGIKPLANELQIAPNIPDGYGYMGVNRMVYGGKSYSVTVYASGKLEVRCDDGVDLVIGMKDTAAKGTRRLNVYDRYNNLISRTTVNAENGMFTLNLTGESNAVYAVLE